MRKNRLQKWMYVVALGLGLSSTVAYADLSPQQIRDVVMQDVPVIQGCYELFLQENPDLAGRFSVNLAIADAGHVTHAVIDESTLRHTELEGCVLAVARAWLFPAPGTAVEVQYPFHFRPQTDAATGPLDQTATAAVTAGLAASPQKTASPSTGSPAKLPVDAMYPHKYFILSVIVGLFLGMGFILRAMGSRKKTA